MKITVIMRLLIVIVLVLSGIFVWYISAEVVYTDPIFIEQGPDNEINEINENNENNLPKVTDSLRNDMDSGYLILVNKSHGLDRDYKPSDLTDIQYYAADRSSETRYMRKGAAGAFHTMVEEARRQDIALVMTTAYRSYDFQSMLYHNYVARDGQAAADTYSARPGHSEHQTGLAVDVSAASVNFDLSLDFANTKEGIWLSENAHLFGFIIRFPEGKEEITGYQYEPWHIRYVGLAAAEYIYAHKITLEEYLVLLEKEMEK